MYTCDWIRICDWSNSAVAHEHTADNDVDRSCHDLRFGLYHDCDLQYTITKISPVANTSQHLE